MSLGPALNLQPSKRFARGILKVVTCFGMRTFRAFVRKGEDYPMKVFDIVFSPTGGTERRLATLPIRWKGKPLL